MIFVCKAYKKVGKTLKNDFFLNKAKTIDRI